MSASIRVESGISAGTSYWIDRPVLRIGSDPQCEICLPSAELAPHALTLEFRGGTYRVYNRGSAPVVIGRVAIQPGTAGPWAEDEVANLPGDLRLVLTFDGDPRPSPRADSQIDAGMAAESAPIMAANLGAATKTPSTKASSSKTLVQLAIIALCGAAVAGFLLMNQGAEAPVANRPTFDSIVQSSLTKDATVRALVQQLQFAQAALVRGHNEIAAAQFLQLRDRLVSQLESLPAADKDDARKMLDYVQFRLGQFQQ